MHSLYYLLQFSLLPLVVILEKVNHVSLLEKAKHPILLTGIFKHSVTIENSCLELPDVEVTVLEKFISKAVEMGVYHIASFNHTQLKLILVSMSIRIVATMTSPENKSEGQSIYKPAFLEPYSKLVPILLTFDVRCLLELVLENSCMVPA